MSNLVCLSYKNNNQGLLLGNSGCRMYRVTVQSWITGVKLEWLFLSLIDNGLSLAEEHMIL